MSFLLDTNVLSEFRKPRPDQAVAQWLTSVRHPLFVSVLVIGELRRGAALMRTRDPHQAQRLDTWIDVTIEDFQEWTLPIDTSVADLWGRLDARGTLPLVDGLLAATAIVHDLTLVTRNVKDVERTGVKLLNPFSE